jgi:serine/threonine-protein kinase HipA
VVKFADGDVVDTPLVEHASMTLAAKAKIRVAETRAIRTTVGHAVAVARFDRSKGTRHHALSAHVALRAAKEPYGYPELAQLLRRRGIAEGELNQQQMRELFRRMVFNILIDNTDDHEKNHAVLLTEKDEYSLSPAYDVLPSGQALGYQQMRVGESEADSTLENARSMRELFGLVADGAEGEIATVAKVVSTWKRHFLACGVTPRDIEALAEHIDRPFLRDQRTDAARKGGTRSSSSRPLKRA